MATGFDWFCPDDLPIFFKALQKTPTPAILVGGQSLTFWIDRFDITIPPIETPYLTMDADVLATKHDAKIVAPASNMMYSKRFKILAMMANPAVEATCAKSRAGRLNCTLNVRY